jgi:hypothetical protein
MEMTRLVTREIAESLRKYPLYAQDGRGRKAVCVCCYSIGPIRWFVLEGQPEGYGYTFYGIVVGMAESEYGYFAEMEMAGIKVDGSAFGLGEIRIEIDPSIHNTPLSEIDDRRLQEFLNRLGV